MALTATVTDYSYDTDYGTAADAKIALNGRAYKIRLYVNEKRFLNPGDTVTGTFRLRYTAPGGQEDVTYHSGQGILLLGYQKGEISVISAREPRWYIYPSILAKEIKDILSELYDPEFVPFVQALLLGDDTDLGYQTETAFRLSGIRHIIAVSGMHVMALYDLIYNLSLRKRWLTALIGIPTLLLFAAVVGLRPSVVRACIMAGMMMLSQIFNREYDPPAALSASVLLMLFVNPLNISDCAFQLTVGCVAGIQLFGSGISEWMKKVLGTPKGKSWIATLKRGFISSVSITLSSMILTTPLSAYYFGTVSLVGVLTNLLTLWIVNLIFTGTAGLCALYFLLPEAAGALAKLFQWPIHFVLTASAKLAAFPLSAVYIRSAYIVIWLFLIYILLTFYLFQKKKRPLQLVLCGTAGLCLALLFSWAEPLMDDVRMTVLDVGQGQSILLQSDGKTFLVDCGGDFDDTTADIAAETLLSQGITRLDGLILTHTDRDHAGGAMNLLSRIQTDRILLPATAKEETVQGIIAAAEGEILMISEDMSISFGDTQLRIFAPIFVDDSNENSLCILFDSENCDILITGDRSELGEQMLIRNPFLGKVDVLVAGHHGSKYSTSQALLNKVQPNVVMISVGADNPYGHPAADTLQRLQSFGCQVYRTDIHGTIIYRR